MKNSKIFVSVLFMITLLRITFSQDRDNGIPKGEFIANNCENNKNIMDSITQHTDKTKMIIVISYLGSNEIEKFNKRRLHNAKTYINQPYNKRENFVITAQGERVKGLGFLDFFIGGVLEYRVFLPKNRDLILSSCQYEPEVKPCSYSFDKMFYPCLAQKGKIINSRFHSTNELSEIWKTDEGMTAYFGDDERCFRNWCSLWGEICIWQS